MEFEKICFELLHPKMIPSSITKPANILIVEFLSILAIIVNKPIFVYSIIFFEAAITIIIVI